MSKALHITSLALQLGSARNQDIGACGSHQEEHQPLGQSNSCGTQEVSAW